MNQTTKLGGSRRGQEEKMALRDNLSAGIPQEQTTNKGTKGGGTFDGQSYNATLASRQD